MRTFGFKNQNAYFGEAAGMHCDSEALKTDSIVCVLVLEIGARVCVLWLLNNVSAS